MVPDTATAEFSFTDIENFIRAKAAIAAGADSSDALQREYFDRASPGLLMFIEKYDLTLERLLDAMGKRPNEYERIPDNHTGCRVG